LEQALKTSPADETELVWLANVTASASARAAEGEPRQSGELLVRIQERGRVGTHRSGTCELPDIAAAIRQALAQARVHAPLAGLPHLPAADSALAPPAISDPAIVALTPTAARDLARRTGERGEAARLSWTIGQAVVANSRGVRRQAQATAATLSVWRGQGPGAGCASQAARFLEELPPAVVAARARGRAAPPASAVAATPNGPTALWLSAEATASFIRAVARTAFAAHTYRDGTSFLRDHLGVQVFDRRIALRDDGSDPRGMPFPFDLEGTAKHPVDLIVAGTVRTPALDQRHAALLGLPSTGHAAGGDEARPEHLFLLPGEASEADLAAATEGGLFVSELVGFELHDPRGANFRARCHGVRRVHDHQLGDAVPNLVWQASVLGVLANVLAVGSECVRIAAEGDWLGSTVAPGLVLGEVNGLRLC
jgi:PmbA protein